MTSRFFKSVLLLILVACAKQPAPSTPARAPIIDPVLFESGSSSISESELDAVEKAADIVTSTDWTLLVLGLADATGDPAANRVLSEARAEAVAAEVRKRVSVPENRIVVHAIGERLSTGESVIERKVELIFFRDEGLPIREVVMKSRVLEEDFRRAR